jgi:general secretion pathway protein G
MVVIAIIMILATIAAGNYQKSVTRAKETTLRTDLKVMRDAIQHYTEDKEAAPSSLDDLVSSHYIQQIPTDPMTNAKDWNTVSEDLDVSPEQSASGITDVHSASDKISPFENDPYSSW